MITTVNRMMQAGKKLQAQSWTDAELQEQINSLKLVIAYLEGTGKADLVVSSLKINLGIFESFERARTLSKYRKIENKFGY
jgi:hypothetical protein